MSNTVKARGRARSELVTLRLRDGSHRQVDLGRHHGGEVFFCIACGAASTETMAGCDCDAGSNCIHRLRETARLFPGALLDMVS